MQSRGEKEEQKSRAEQSKARANKESLSSGSSTHLALHLLLFIGPTAGHTTSARHTFTATFLMVQHTAQQPKEVHPSAASCFLPTAGTTPRRHLPPSVRQWKEKALATPPVQQHLRPAGQPFPLQMPFLLLFLQGPLQLILWGSTQQLSICTASPQHHTTHLWTGHVSLHPTSWPQPQPHIPAPQPNANPNPTPLILYANPNLKPSTNPSPTAHIPMQTPVPHP